MSRTRSALRAARTLVVVGAVAALALATGGPAQASGKTSNGGDFAVTLNGRVYNPAAGQSVTVKSVTPTGTIAVRGRNVGFDVDPATLGVYRYTLTGAPDTQRMVTAPTVVFASKVPTLTAAQRSGLQVRELQVKDDSLVLIFTTAAGKLKIQAKDGAQGGIFQMEPEFGSPVEITHTLGSGLFYFTNPFTGKINFGDGIAAVSPTQSATGYHQMLLGKDSPQVATKTYQDGTTTRWLVASGGRMGGVLGEDAIELSQGATNCTSNCQAQNRIRGSVPVPPDPVNPTPIGG